MQLPLESGRFFVLIGGEKAHHTLTTPKQMAYSGITEEMVAEHQAKHGRKRKPANPSSAAEKAQQTVRLPAQKQVIRQPQKDSRKPSEIAFETEFLFPAVLEGRLLEYSEHESHRLKLGEGVTFKPDYPALEPVGDGYRLVFFEVKGKKYPGQPRAEDDAVVKLKWAAKQYKRYRFVICWKEGGLWMQQPVIGGFPNG